MTLKQLREINLCNLFFLNDFEMFKAPFIRGFVGLIHLADDREVLRQNHLIQ